MEWGEGAGWRKKGLGLGGKGVGLREGGSAWRVVVERNDGTGAYL